VIGTGKRRTKHGPICEGGDVVVTLFPYSDLSESKKRPALTLASLKGDDVILCQITSRAIGDDYAVTIEAKDFVSGRLNSPSNARPNRLFTADSRIILYRAGTLSSEKMDEILNAILSILRG
jgi:mRNA interferase MazF